MRDIKRISPFLQKFEEAWKLYPDLRFGQFIDSLEAWLPQLGRQGYQIDPFQAEEGHWLTALEKFMEINGIEL